MNRRGSGAVPLGMWTDARLTAAVEALPPEAFLNGAPEDFELMWRRMARRLREADGPADPPAPDHLAPVISLSRRRRRR